MLTNAISISSSAKTKGCEARTTNKTAEQSMVSNHTEEKQLYHGWSHLISFDILYRVNVKHSVSWKTLIIKFIPCLKSSLYIWQVSFLSEES